MTPQPSLYPPGTNPPSESQTPQRAERLNTRGTIVLGIDYVMSTLQQLYPRRIFPADGPVDSQRSPVVCPVGWKRGGTSPSGVDYGGPTGGNYFIGSSQTVINSAAPQRIVWERPKLGEELLMPLSMVGPYKDPSIQQLPQLLTPLNPATPQYFRQMGDFAAAQWALRIIPMTAHLWMNDDDDGDEFIHWFLGAVQLCFNGNINGMDVCTPLGYVEDEKTTRGLHWQCVVRFAAPLHYPYFGEAVGRSASVTVTGAAPNAVVSTE